MPAYNYNQNWNALNDGPVNGQDGWVDGSNTVDVLTTGLSYEGTKCVWNDSTGSVGVAKDYAYDSGVCYFAMMSTNNGVNSVYVNGRLNNNPLWGVYFRDSGYIHYFDGNTLTQSSFPYVADQWYAFAVELDGSGAQYRWKVNSGSGWSDWQGWYTTFDSGTTTDKLQVGFSSTTASYFDTWSTTDITVFDHTKSLTDTVSVSESIEKTNIFLKEPTESLAIQSEIRIGELLSQKSIENISFVESLVYQSAFELAPADQLDFTESLTHTIPGWTYKEDFNSLNNGVLNGQDSWTGSTDYVIQTAVKYEGTKAVAVNLLEANNENIYRVITATSSGSVFVAMRKTASVEGEGRIYFILNEGTTAKIVIDFDPSNNISYYVGGVGYQTYSTYNDNQWYIVAIEFDNAAHPNKYRIKARPDGDSWGDWTSWVATYSSYTNIDRVRFETGNDIVGMGYFDIITSIDPSMYRNIFFTKTLSISENIVLDSTARDTGWKSPTISGASGYDNWIDGDNAKTDDSNFAYQDNAVSYLCNTSAIEGYSTFDFGIPAGAIIKGIEFAADVSALVGSGKIYASLCQSGGFSCGDNLWTDVNVQSKYTITLGGSANTWGLPEESLVASFFNDTNFLFLPKICVASGGTTKVYWVRLKIHYTISVPYSKDLSENIALAELEAKNINLKSGLFGDVVFTETIKKTTRISFINVLNIYESFLRRLEYFKNLVDDINISVSLSKSFKKIFSEIFSSFESISISSTFKKIFSESFTLLSSITNNITKRVEEILFLIESVRRETKTSIISSLSIYESTLKRFVYSKKLIENININIDLLKTFDKSFQEIFSSDESINLLTSFKNLVENINVNISLIKILDRSFQETFSIDESITLLSTFKKIFSADLNVSESFLKETDKTLEEILSVIESVEKISEYKKALIETLSISDALTKTIIYQRMIIETLSLTEELQKITNIPFYSALFIAESLFKKSEYSKSLIENISFAESLSRMFDHNQNINILINFAEDLSKKTDVSFSDTILILESFLKISESKLNLVDTFALVEEITKENKKLFSEIFSIIESSYELLINEQRLYENLSISDQLKKIIQLSISGNMNIQEINILTSEFVSVFSDYIQLSEEQKLLNNYFKTEILSFSEFLTKSIEVKRQEHIIITEAFKKALNMKKTDALYISESLFRKTSMSISDILNIIESPAISSYKDFIENITFSEALDIDIYTAKKLFETLSIVDSIRFDADKKLDSIVIVYENILPEMGTSIFDRVDIGDVFSKSIFIGIMNNVNMTESLMRDFGLSILEALSISENLREAEETEPLKRKVHLFTKDNKTYLFRKIRTK